MTTSSIFPRTFRTYLAATTAETTADAAVKTVVPLAAVSLLGAGTELIGILNALGMAAFLLLGVSAGSWVDRGSARWMMTASSAVRGVLMAVIVVLIATETLEVCHLLVGMGLVGICDVFFSAASSVMLPRILPGEQLSDGVGRQLSCDTAAAALAPATLGGVLRIAGLGVAAVLMPVGYLISAIGAYRLRGYERPTESADTKPRRGVREGLIFTFSHPIIRALMLSNMLINAASALGGSVVVVFSVRTLGLTEMAVALAASVAAAGGFVGSVIAAGIVRRWGIGRIRITACVLASVCVALLPASAALGLPAQGVFFLMEFMWSLLTAISIVAGGGIIPRLTPDALLGRVASNIRVVTLGIMPVASIIGGALGATAGAEVVLVGWACLALLAAVPIVLSPVGRWQAFPRDREAPRE